MSEKPILFSSEMVRAILEGRKTQTRRVIKDYPNNTYKPTGDIVWSDEPMGSFHELLDGAHEAKHIRCPYNHPGDKLWVRETWAKSPNGFIYKADFNVKDGFGSDVVDLKTGESNALVWKPSIHMPREASRITLEIVNVRVERVKDITAKDALAEGIDDASYSRHKKEDADMVTISKFTRLWNSINAKRGFGWDVNPWVWVIEFKVL